MTSVAAIDHADLILLLLGAPTIDPEQRDRCAGVTRLEKLIYVLDSESEFRQLAREPTEDLNFRPFHYGPYSEKIYDAVELLVAIGLVQERRTPTASGLDMAEELRGLEDLDVGAILGPDPDEPYVERSFELSEKGRYVARILLERVGPDAVAQVSAIKDAYGAMPLRQLLRRVYRDHPQMTTRSRIKDSL
jgi:hypothetical protein